MMAGTREGTLDGIPIGHKDIYNTAGIRTTGALQAAGAQRARPRMPRVVRSLGRGRHGAAGQAGDA